MFNLYPFAKPTSLKILAQKNLVPLIIMIYIYIVIYACFLKLHKLSYKNYSWTF